MGFILHNFYGKAAAAFLVRTQTLRIVTCDNIIMLHAEIIGFAGTAKFRWEQVSGQPVVFLEDQNQVTVTFQQTQIRDDKVFAFYVNKDTALEQRFLVTVTAVPMETITLQKDVPSVSNDYWDAELPSVAIFPSVVPADTGRFIDFTDLADKPLFSYTGGTRATYSMVFTSYSYGTRKELIAPVPLEAGQLSSSSALMGFDKRTQIYVELGVPLPKTDFPSWIMKKPINPTVNPGLAVTDKSTLTRTVVPVSTVVGELFLVRDNILTQDSLLGLNKAVTPDSRVVAEWFLTLDYSPVNTETIGGLNMAVNSNSAVVATNFIDKSSIG